MAAPSRDLAHELLHEVYYHASQLATSRVARSRSRGVIDAWLDAELRAFGDGPYWSYVDGAAAWRDGRTPARAWVAPTFRPRDKHDMPPPYVLLLSGDAQRTLLFTWIPGTDLLYAVALPVAEILALRAARIAQYHLLAAIEGLELSSLPPIDHQIDVAASFSGAPDLTLPAATSDARRDTWLADCLGRFGARFTGGWYFVSLPVGQHTPWHVVHGDDAIWLGALWRTGNVSRLLVMDDDEQGTLALSAGDRYEARLRVLAKR